VIFVCFAEENFRLTNEYELKMKKVRGNEDLSRRHGAACGCCTESTEISPLIFLRASA